MVRSRRLELPRPFGHSDLNAARLPVPPRPHADVSGAGLPTGERAPYQPPPAGSSGFPNEHRAGRIAGAEAADEAGLAGRQRVAVEVDDRDLRAGGKADARHADADLLAPTPALPQRDACAELREQWKAAPRKP
mgnify:CR=1 FL=1